jgi:hypothetical protein
MQILLLHVTILVFEFSRLFSQLWCQQPHVIVESHRCAVMKRA